MKNNPWDYAQNENPQIGIPPEVRAALNVKEAYASGLRRGFRIGLGIGVVGFVLGAVFVRIIV